MASLYTNFFIFWLCPSLHQYSPFKNLPQNPRGWVVKMMTSGGLSWFGNICVSFVSMTHSIYSIRTIFCSNLVQNTSGRFWNNTLPILTFFAYINMIPGEHPYVYCEALYIYI